MGWWETYDGTVIGDGLADLVGADLDKMVASLVKKYPSIARDQVLHTIALCSGHLKQFDEERKRSSQDKILAVMTVQQAKRWRSRHEVAPDMSKRIAPDTKLTNVFNPFTGKI